MSDSRTGDFQVGANCPPAKPSQAEGEASRNQQNVQQPPKPSKAEGEDFRQTAGGSTSSGSVSAASPTAARSASEAAREVKDAAMEVADDAKREAAHLASDARQAVASQAAKIQQTSADYVARQKDCLVDEVSHVGAAVRQAAQKLHEEGDDRIASYVEQAASGIEGVGNYLRDRDASALCDDFEQLARRRPEVVYGGLFIAGLGIARFLKASRRPQQVNRNYQSSGDDWNGPAYYDDPDSYRDSITGKNDPYYATAEYMTAAVAARYPEGEENRDVF